MGCCVDSEKHIAEQPSYRPTPEKIPELKKKIFTNKNAVSRKCSAYYCYIVDCFIDGNSLIIVKIDKHADGSKGPCTDPDDSTLLIGGVEMKFDKAYFTRESELTGYTGDLLYHYNGEKGKIEFTYGDDDYSTVELGEI